MTQSPFPYAAGICTVLFCLFATAIPCSGWWMEIHLGGGGTAMVSPAEILITDPLGRRTGYEPSTRTIVREIPEGEYGRESIADVDYPETGEAGPETIQLALGGPEAGTYRLTLTGVRRGEFWLEFQLDDISGKFAHKVITGQTDQGRTYRYRIEYSPKSADETLVVPDTYRFRFLPPFRSESVSVVRAGSTVPIRFRLVDSEGNIPPRVMATVRLQKLAGDAPDGEPIKPPSKTSSGRGKTIQYIAKTNTYSFRLSTKSLSKGKWKVIIRLEDGAEHTAFIELK